MNFYYNEPEINQIPATLLSLLESTRQRLRTMGRFGAQLRLLGGPVSRDKILDRVSAETLLRIREEDEHHVHADADANLSYKYGSWLHDDPANQERIRGEIQNLMPGADTSGFFWYPAGGYEGWHTNANRPGERISCTYTEEEGRSFFRFQVPGTKEIRTSWDRKGWTCRRSILGSSPESLLWHCLYAEVYRMCFIFYRPKQG